MRETDANQKDVLSLALVGDAVFSLFVRARLINQFDCKSGLLSKKSVEFVSAKAQSKMYHAIESRLTEQELAIARRARNCLNHSKAKNASIIDYKKATALEAVIGYLYLTEQTERLEKLQELCYRTIENCWLKTNLTTE